MNKKASLRQFWQNFFHGIALNNFEISLLHEVQNMKKIDKHSSTSCHFLYKTKLLDNQNICNNDNTKNLFTRYYQLSYSIYKTIILIHQLLQKTFLLILKKKIKLISCRTKTSKLSF